MSENVELKPLEEQVIVITGASSGIGLTTARMAADRGARLVLAARSEEALQELVEEIEAKGGEATYVVADVSEPSDVREISRAAQERFNRFDTWVNNAGVFMYGRLQDVPVEDMRELFETNVWGLVYGSLEATRHLKKEGGTLINIGSVLSERAVLLQGSYSASKHAVKGFTDALRMELEDEDAPVSVTLVKPSAIDTPYPEHARNHMDAATEIPPPVYAPETVAHTVLRCAEQPERDVFVGAGGKSLSVLGHAVPSLTDRIMEALFVDFQRKDEPPRPDTGKRTSLDSAAGSLDERGGYEGHVAESSLYTKAALRPELLAGVLVSVGAVAAVLRARCGRRDR